ncbi:hypothetical protein NMG60_11027480 [Bertholletia excelsa]
MDDQLRRTTGLATNARGPNGRSTTHNCKYQWTVNEDALLVMCLLELKIEGTFLAENGFKPRYLNALEAMMEQKAPGCGIKGKPHIQSRLKTMKTDWQTVYDMVYGQNTSGFGWDNENKCITAEKEVWEAYIKSNKRAALFRGKTLPHFDDLCIIWGKDRATGKDAQSVEDILEEERTNEGDIQANMDETINLNGIDDMNVSMSFTKQHLNKTSATSSSKKRKRRDLKNDDLFVNVLKEVATSLESGLLQATDKLGQYVRSLSHEASLNNKQETIYSELMKVEELNQDEKIAASVKISTNLALLHVFPTIPADDKAKWVRHVLNSLLI